MTEPYWPRCQECGHRRGQTKRGLCNNCYQRARRHGDIGSSLVDATFARAHVMRLLDHGMALREIERAAGLHHGRLHVLIHGRGGKPPLATVARKTHDALLGIPVPGPDYQPHPRAGLANPRHNNGRTPRPRPTPFYRLYVEMADDLLMTDQQIADKLGIERDSVLRNIDRNRDKIQLLRAQRIRGRQLAERKRG